MRLFGILAFGVIGTAILIGLGIWQTQRLAWKETVLADIQTRISAAPVAVPAGPEERRDIYLPVQTLATFEKNGVRVLVSQKIYGAGYRLIHAVQTQTGRRLLVDRGFVSVNSKIPPAPDGQVKIEGNLHWPKETDSFTPENDLPANIWFARDVERLADHFKTEPVLVIARSIESDTQMQPLPVGTAGIPNDHLQYAITWFSLAAIWLGMTAYFLYRSTKRQA